MDYRANGMHLTIGELAACIRLIVEVGSGLSSCKSVE